MNKQTEDLLQRLGLNWENINVYNKALTHTSYANENKALHLSPNERLEFLGDAVLELVVSEYLYKNFRNFPEGLLTKTRAAVVCESSLAGTANQIDLGSFIKIGKGEERSGGRRRPSLLADALEALIGAVYLDQGLEVARNFILKMFSADLNEMAEKGGNVGDYKTELQEIVQQKTDIPLVYNIINEEGPDHDKTFTAAVTFNNRTWGEGSGRTKKEAEQDAAKKALEQIRSGNIIIAKGRS